MIDLDTLSTTEAAAYAAGLRDALEAVDQATDGKRSLAIGEAGRWIHRTARKAALRGRRPPELVMPPAIRQSLIASFDQCTLETRFDLEVQLRQSAGEMGNLAATGSLFHMFAARAINHMRAHREPEIGVDMAMELLLEVISQRDIPSEDVIHLPLRELRWLRSLVVNWCLRETFDIEKVVAVERQLQADIECVGPGGERYIRTLTGRPDVLIAGPRSDEATVIDWKSGFAPPPTPRPTKAFDVDTGQEVTVQSSKLSDMGYVQQVVYGFLVLENFPLIQRVTERESYVRHNGEVREATVERWEMERIRDVLSAVVSQMDAAISEGAKSKRWFPVPGSHCGFCPTPRDCPISAKLGIPTTLEEVQRVGGEWHVAAQVRQERLPYLKGWVDAHGPFPVAHAKGRREIGWVKNKTGGGRSFKMYEPDDAADSPLDPLLEAAARDAGVLTDG